MSIPVRHGLLAGCVMCVGDFAYAAAARMQYTGTGALKTDYTRTGRRTKWGLVQGRLVRTRTCGCVGGVWVCARSVLPGV